MSGIEPGRPKIEEREAQFIWNGTRILTETGVEWTVIKIEEDEEGFMGLRVQRTVTDWIYPEPTDLIRCRVEEEDR